MVLHQAIPGIIPTQFASRPLYWGVLDGVNPSTREAGWHTNGLAQELLSNRTSGSAFLLPLNLAPSYF